MKPGIAYSARDLLCCVGCPAWSEYEDTHGERGQCRAHPPDGGPGLATWPNTAWNEWCAEHPNRAGTMAAELARTEEPT